MGFNVQQLIKGLVHISTNTDKGGKSMACVRVWVCVFVPYLCYAWKNTDCFPSSSLQPRRLITILRQQRFLHSNKVVINIYENKTPPPPWCPLYAPERVCVCVHSAVCVFSTHALCVHSDSVFRGNCSLWCSQMQPTADSPISSHQADASYASASPSKLVHFNAKWNKTEMSCIQVQPGDVSTKTQNHTLYLGR